MRKQSVESVVQAFEAGTVRYLLVGGLAVVAHGVVRFTADMDVVLDMTSENIQRAVRVLTSLGYKPRAPVPLGDFADSEKRAEWVAQKGLTVFSLWNASDPMTEIDLFIENPFDDFERAYQSSVQLEIAPGVMAHIVGLSDLIALKQKANRPQDIRDIEKLRQLERVNGKE